VETSFIGGAYQGRSLNLNAQQCINFYPVIDQQDGKSVIALFGTSGLKPFADLNRDGEEGRGLHVFGDNLYVVSGNTVYKVDGGGTATAISATLNTSTGYVWMADNGTQIMLVDGSSGYIITNDALTEITDASFPTPSSLTFQDGYFIVSKKDTGEFYISALDDGTSWDATDFATAETNPDNLVTIISDHRELWLFGEKNIEVWYNSGGADFPFERISSAYIEHGCGAAASVAKGDNSLFWFADDGTVRRVDGYTPVIISTRQIEYQISKYSTVSDAVGFYYTETGHGFYQLTFPSALDGIGATWVYDAATGLWHQKRSYPIYDDGSEGRHRANCYAYFQNKHIVADYKNGKIYEFDLDTYKDDTENIRRTRTAQVIHADRKNIFFHSFEIDVESGVGLSVNDSDIGSGADPQAMLDWSDDGGHTWSNEHWVTLGQIGENTKRAIWRKLGRSRERIFRVTISDPIKTVIIAAHLEASLGLN
jgi:hypothetical protein